MKGGFLCADDSLTEVDLKSDSCSDDCSISSFSTPQLVTSLPKGLVDLDKQRPTSSSVDGQPDGRCLPFLKKGLRKLKNALSQITIEPVIFCYIVAATLQGTLTTSLLLDKVCELHFEYDKEECANLTSYPKEEDEVQTVVSQYNMYLKLIQNIPTVLFVLFLGPWSDANGRKLPMILPFVGCLIASLICMMNSYFWWLPPEHILMSAVPRSMTGGFTTLMMASYSYISDLTKHQSRTTRIAFVDMMFIISPPLGMYLSDVLYTYIGYTGVYSVSMSIYLVSIIYILYFIEDTRGTLSKMSPIKSPGENLFDVGNVKATVLTCLRRGQYRSTILLLMANICLMSMIFGCMGMDYLYTQKKFSWTYSQYVKLGTTQLILSGVGTSVILPIMSFWLGAEDVFLGVLGCLSKISGSLLQAFARRPWHLYLASAVSLTGGTPFSVARSKISKLVDPDELGKVFSMLASWECIVPLVATPIYTFTYNATLEAFPGAIFVISAVVFGVATLIFLYIFWKSRQLNPASEF